MLHVARRPFGAEDGTAIWNGFIAALVAMPPILVLAALGSSTEPLFLPGNIDLAPGAVRSIGTP
jgi:hypothetical protein